MVKMLINLMDFVFLQNELWMTPEQLSKVSEVTNRYESHGPLHELIVQGLQLHGVVLIC